MQFQLSSHLRGNRRRNPNISEISGKVQKLPWELRLAEKVFRF